MSDKRWPVEERLAEPSDVWFLAEEAIAVIKRARDCLRVTLPGGSISTAHASRAKAILEEFLQNGE